MKNIKKYCEILVIGAGASGVTAAVSASLRGADTILVEKNSFPGGAAVTGLHRFICGLYVNGAGRPKKTLNDGIVREVCSRLKTMSPDKTVARMGNVYVLPFFTKDLVAAFRSLIHGANRLKALYNFRVVSVKTDGKLIKVVRGRTPRGIVEIHPKVVIDCSGNAVVVRLSGAQYSLSPLKQRQLSSYGFRVKGLRKIDEMVSIQVPYYVKRAVEEKKLANHLKFTTFYPGYNRGEGTFKLSVMPIDGVNSVVRVKADARKLHRYLTSTIASFRSSYITEMSSEVLDREGIRVKGEYSLKTEDVIKARKFPDGIVKNAWPIELWNQKKGPQYQYLDPGEYYHIPLRCIKAKDISNLYCAGRCISASRQALGSTRIMGACMSLGEQAGFAAAKRVGL